MMPHFTIEGEQETLIVCSYKFTAP